MEKELNYLSEKIEGIEHRIDKLNEWLGKLSLEIIELEKEVKLLKGILNYITVTELES